MVGGTTQWPHHHSARNAAAGEGAVAAVAVTVAVALAAALSSSMSSSNGSIGTIHIILAGKKRQGQRQRRGDARNLGRLVSNRRFGLLAFSGLLGWRHKPPALRACRACLLPLSSATAWTCRRRGDDGPAWSELLLHAKTQAQRFAFPSFPS